MKQCCMPDCPDRHEACHDTCAKYLAWKQELAKQSAYTRQKNEAGVIHRRDFDAEFWM